MSEHAREAQTKIIRKLISSGLQVVDAARVDVRGSLKFGNNVQIDINVIFKGDVVLGDDISIGPNCIIDDSIIGPGVEIKENTTLSSATIESDCRIGPYARIRPGSIIGAGSHIGNFVEIKNTVMGAGCKINHHSFVGDAQLGQHVIIGAGAITCNFDGLKVGNTIIEDRVFIGSGVQLIAPCKIGEGAFVGAGSIITKDVPPGMLALCRPQEMFLKALPPKDS
jgi:bifunctional UDP-N-acetylglucosamine pyrophosphorylase/glucosamine-1-phosphate N-acetyltransferase